ncbi:MAG: hypothetical protein LAO21_08570 [Acidobacteriia bacterium]|nr:hypothetical protein [Terriglobia bacterium]
MKLRKTLILRLGIMAILLLLAALPMMGQTEYNWRLRYAQVANGVSGNSTYVTTLVVSNPEDRISEVQLEDFDHNIPMNALRTQYFTDCFVTASTTTTLNFQVPPHSSCKLDTDGVGTLETGWLRVTEVTNSHNLGGYLSWTYYAGNQFTGMPLFTVGVSPTRVYNQISIPVLRDFATGEDTGYALVNPYNSGITMQAQLYDKSGVVRCSGTISFAAFAHAAQMVSELCPVTLATATGFVGNLILTGSTGSDAAIGTAVIARRGAFGGATASMSVDSHVDSKRAQENGREEAATARSSFNVDGKWNPLLLPKL